MSAHTQLKGAGKSRHLPIGSPGSCLTEDDRSLVTNAADMTGPECRRCRAPATAPKLINIQFTLRSRQLATVLDVARAQAAAAFGCIDDDPALVVTVGTGQLEEQDGYGRHGGDWLFLVNASWDTDSGTLEPEGTINREGGIERRRSPDRRIRSERRG